MTRLRRVTSESVFTLTEIMVVLGVVGILVSIATVSCSYFVKKAKAVEAETTLNEVQRLEDLYYAEYGRYSSDLPSIGFSPMTPLKYYSLKVQLPTETTGLGYQATANPVGAVLVDMWVLTQFANGATTIDTIHQLDVTHTDAS